MFKPTDEQQAVIDAPQEGAYVVSAGPGSGKTATMALRYQKLVRDYEVDPGNIIAVTFSKAMADELGIRISRFTPEADLRQICTIHALLYRILMEEGERRRVPGDREGWKIKAHTKTALEQAGLPDIGWKDAQQWFGTAKINGIRADYPGKLEEFYKGLIERAGGCTHPEYAHDLHTRLEGTHKLFDYLMSSDRSTEAPHGFLTFSDMVCEAIWLFEDKPTVLQKYQQRYQYVIIDEAQDTTGWATKLLWMLAAPQDNIMVIGDEDQWLYGFAGAKPDHNMRQGFRNRFPEATLFKLTVNFRSTAVIVNTSSLAIAGNYGPRNEEYRKTLIPREGVDEGVTITYDIFPNTNEESAAVAEFIADGKEAGDFEEGDVFVLARTRAYLGYLEGALVRRGIKFLNEKGGTFWDSWHVRQLVHYMRLSINRGDNDAFSTVYNLASDKMKLTRDQTDRQTGRIVRYAGDYINHRWLGKKFLEACNGSWHGMDDAERQRRSWSSGIRDLRNFMREVDEHVKPGDKAKFIVDHCLLKWWQMEEGLEVDDESETSRLGDLMMVVDMAGQFQNCELFFAYIDKMIEAAEDAKAGDKSKLVILTTIHGSKGRERPVVINMGVMDGMLPHALSLMPPLAKDGQILPALCGGGNSVEAERCMWFVAMSRAERIFKAYGSRFVTGTKLLEPSRFAEEVGLLDSALIEQVSAVVEGVLGDDEPEASEDRGHFQEW